MGSAGKHGFMWSWFIKFSIWFSLGLLLYVSSSSKLIWADENGFVFFLGGIKRQTIISPSSFYPKRWKTLRSDFLGFTSSTLFSITFILVYSWCVSFFHLGIDRKGVNGGTRLLWLDLHWLPFIWRYVPIIIRICHFALQRCLFIRLRHIYLLLKAFRIWLHRGLSPLPLFSRIIFSEISWFRLQLHLGYMWSPHLYSWVFFGEKERYPGY